MIDLVEVSRKEHIETLYELLKERTPEQSISHKGMPSYKQHAQFVIKRPYKVWYLIQARETGEFVGSIYLSKLNEIGVFVFRAHRGHRYGTHAVQALMRRWNGPWLWNVAPNNWPSQALALELGGKLLQRTYLIEDKIHG